MNMEDQKILNFFTIKSNWKWHLLYWIFSACIMFFLFSNKEYNLQIRLSLVMFLIAVSILITLLINRYLIHRFLFTGKLFLFAYLILAIFIVTFWLISFSVILILTYSVLKLPDMLIPTTSEIMILVTGNYLLVIIAVVIHFIKESYKRLVEKNNIEKQKQLTEIKLKEASLKLLQGQIHPHFLFNMLNNLYGLVKEDVESSREIIMKLSELLDYMLYECDKPETVLKNEITFIENYIELERIRHDENFNVKMSFSKEIADIEIAPLILFPFVENAFKHGFHNPEKSFINIELNFENDILKFEIENSFFKKSKDRYLKQEGKGIGLKNIKDRLELIYKNKYTLNIFEQDNTFKAELEIELK